MANFDCFVIHGAFTIKLEDSIQPCFSRAFQLSMTGGGWIVELGQ